MFNRCEARDIDMHLRRFYVRPDGFGGKEPFRVAAIRVVNFGEKSAGNTATAITNRTAEDNAHISPEVSKMIINDCFMDDCFVNAKYDEKLMTKLNWLKKSWQKVDFPSKVG